MSEPPSISFLRWSGVSAIVGGGICLVLTPIQSYIWGQDESPPWVLFFRPALDATLEASPIEPYDFYGRMFFVVYLLIIPILVGVYRLHSDGRSRLERAGFWISLGCLLIATVGDFLAYWSGSEEVSGFAPLQGYGYGVELISIQILMLGAVAFGVTLIRSRMLPRPLAWWLCLAMPLGFPTALIVGYVPHGLMLPYSLGWAATGITLIFGSSIAVNRGNSSE